MKTILSELCSDLQELPSETCGILHSSNLTVHDAVYCVALVGSRGRNGTPREDSDIDLSLLVDSVSLTNSTDRDTFLRELLGVTLDNWRSSCELDAAAIFDKSGCRLLCYDGSSPVEVRCGRAQPDCIGVFKIHKGFNGFVPDIGIDVKRLFPITTIWRRSQSL